jgi:hypothetical protein
MNIATTMNTTSANNATSNQLGSPDAESEETIDGLGEGVAAASGEPLKMLDESPDKPPSRTRSTAYLPFLSDLRLGNANRYGLGLAWPIFMKL